MRTTSFCEAYRSLLTELHHHSDEQVNERTGVAIKYLHGGHSFKLDLGTGRLPVAHNRRYFPKVAAVEAAWEFMGTRDPAFVLAYAPKLWSKFVEDGEIKCAYGYRWRHHFGRDQLHMALRALTEDPTNRQVYVSTWDPAADGLGAPDQPKNVPCIAGFSLTCDGHNGLHMSVFIRSSDVFVGLPYDVMCYALKLDAFAASMDRTPRTLHVTLAHPHVYQPHFGMLEHSVSVPWSFGEPALPAWDMEQILEDPDGYVTTVGRLGARIPWSEYSPKPEVVA